MPLKFQLCGDAAFLREGIAIVDAALGCAEASVGRGAIPLTVTRTDKPELTVEFDGTEAHIHYRDRIHFFRAYGLLIETLGAQESERYSPFRIHEVPQFDTLGVMMDCSRNAVMKVESVQHLLGKMAIMGMNTLMLYTEDTYTVEDEPYFGYMRGRYTPEELRACDDFAAKLGIEMIPCIQTLAHLEQFLKWEAAASLRDTHDVLLVGQEQTYDFIDRMIRSAIAPFRSKRIHIGMDEAHGLGRGRFLDLKGYRNRFEMMEEHLHQVLRITDAYGLKPMIWSDMFFRIGSATHDYYDLNAIVDERLVQRMPENVQLVYWDYYHHDDAFYEAFIRKHEAFGDKPVFAGGIWTWLGIGTNYSRTILDSNAALRACKKTGVREVFATMWGDNGAENNMFSSLPCLQLFAEHGYAAHVDEEKWKKRSTFCTGIDFDRVMDLRLLDEIPGSLPDNRDSSNPSKYLLWQDVLMGLFDKHIEGLGLSEHYGKLEERLREHRECDQSGVLLFEVPEKLCAVLKRKAELGLRLKSSYDARDIEALKQIALVELPMLIESVKTLHQAHRKQWFAANKPFGWEVIELRYGGLVMRLATAADRMTTFLEGGISRIEELEEERLFFDGPVRPSDTASGLFHRYHSIASANAFW